MQHRGRTEGLGLDEGLPEKGPCSENAELFQEVVVNRRTGVVVGEPSQAEELSSTTLEFFIPYATFLSVWQLATMEKKTPRIFYLRLNFGLKNF